MAIKTMAKAVLGSAVRRLPWGARAAVFEALCAQMGNNEVLVRAATKIGVTEFGAPGQWGVIQSAATDRAILPTYARTGDWAQRTHQVFSNFFGELGGTYLDIGANIGLTTLPVARNPRVRCFAFEPEPTNFASLQNNVRRNAVHGNITLHKMALWDRHGSITFGLAEDGNLGDHRVVTTESSRRTIEVTAAPLDDLDLPIEGRLGVKIDTQGAEPAIINGGRMVLARARLVVMEFSPFMIAQLGGDPEVVITYLSEFERIALVAGESKEDLVFRPAATACAELRQTFARARADEADYLDIYAER